MNRIIKSGSRHGSIDIPSSKSMAQRLIIASALSKNESRLICRGLSKDICATVSCLNSLGSTIKLDASGLDINPFYHVNKTAVLDCGESGATLRFLLPLTAALGVDARFVMGGRLPLRPIDDLERELRLHGVSISRDKNSILCSGSLQAGGYTVSGEVSSQYVSALLFALPLLEGDSRLSVEGKLNSSEYVKMTEAVLRNSGINFEKRQNVYTIHGRQRYTMPTKSVVEGDWSAAAFFLCMGAVSNGGISVHGLDLSSTQGDRRIVDILQGFGARLCVSENSVTVSRGELIPQHIDSADIPDLVLPLAMLATVCEGESSFENVGRLCYKESDRLSGITELINSLGGCAYVESDRLIVSGGKALSATVLDSHHDHRLAMTVAEAACFCGGQLKLTDPLCVEKSYPAFWEDYSSLEVENELLW